MGFFSNRTVYQIVSTFEILFSILILSFSINILFILYDDAYMSLFVEGNIENLKKALVYAAAVGIVHSVIQIVASVLLVLKSKTGDDQKDPGLTPKLWLLQSIIQLGFLLFMFLFPLSFTIQNEMTDLRKSVKEFFTYTITNAMFKLFFIWMIYTTVQFRKSGKDIDEVKGKYVVENISFNTKNTVVVEKEREVL